MYNPRYLIVNARNSIELERQVEAMMDKGFIPQGGICIIECSYPNNWLGPKDEYEIMQAMVRKT